MFYIMNNLYSDLGNSIGEREGAGGVLQQSYGKEEGERVELGGQEPLYSSTAYQL